MREDGAHLDAPKRANVVLGGVLAIVLVAAIAALAFTGMGAGAGAGADAGADAGAGSSGQAGQGLRAIVHDGEGAVHELPLSQDAELVVETPLGTNVVVVEDGAVYVRQADCDNQDCVHQGKLSAPGRQIICLPHKLWIEVVAAGDEGGDMDVEAVASEGLDVVAR